MKFLQSLLPEKNVLSGYLAGVFVYCAVHLLAMANVALTTDQTLSLSAAAAIVVAHMIDTFNKITEK